MQAFEDIHFDEATQYKPCLSFAIITATEIEFEEVLKNIRPLPTKSALLRIFKDNSTYYLGTFGEYGVVFVQSGMAAASSTGSIVTTEAAIRNWEPKAVVMLGIAFGANSKKQNIGDILIPKRIIPYELKKVDNGVKIFRSEVPATSLQLVNRFSAARYDWKHLLPNNQKAKIHVGAVLSGDVLINDLKYRDDLLRDFPEAIGGEMEANGIYIAAMNNRLEWIVVKAICDFADGNKSNNPNKKAYQQTAISSVVNLAVHVFSNKFAFEELGFKLVEDCMPKGNTAPKENAPAQPLLNIEEANQLRDLIARNNLQMAMDILANKIKQGGSQDANSVIFMKQKEFNDLKQKERLGILTYDEARRTNNRITLNILELINELL